MSPRRLLVSLFLILAVVATACGSDSPADDEASATGSSPTASDTTTTTESSTDDATTASSTVEEAPTTRVVDHDSGTTEIPARAERIYTNSFVVISHLVAMGITPIAVPEGVAEWLQPQVDAGYLADIDTTAIPTAGTSVEPSLETIAGLQPDLIIIEDWAAAQGYDIFSEIAPTVTISRPTNADWKFAFDQAADFTGRADEADAVRRRYADVVAGLGQNIDDTVVTFLRGAQAGSFRIDAEAGFAGSVGLDAGFILDVGGQTETEDESWILLSNEELLAVTGDVIVTTPADDGSSNTTELRATSLWPMLEAVQNDAIVEFPVSIYNGGSYVAAEIMLLGLRDALG
ncbi:MAG: ABC transporter substrate-binding protein [Actinomycetota bacterium]